MKVIQKFKENEEIPNDAKYLYSEKLITSYKEFQASSYWFDEPIYTTFHYYEIPAISRKTYILNGIEVTEEIFNQKVNPNNGKT